MSLRNILIWGLPCLLGSASPLSATPLTLVCQAKYGMFVDCSGDGIVTYQVLASGKARPLDKGTRHAKCNLWVPKEGTAILDVKCGGSPFQIRVVPSDYDEKDANFATFSAFLDGGETKIEFQGNKMMSHALELSGPNRYILKPVGHPKPITGRPELPAGEHREERKASGAGS